MENKELLELLKSRGFEVKSVSSTIDNISAEALRDELLNKNDAESESAAMSTVWKAEPAAPQIPMGAFVKSAKISRRNARQKLPKKRLL